MDRARLQQQLARAERHVALGEEHLAHQQHIIAQLQGAGHDSSEAHLLLRQFREVQALHIAHRDRLRKALLMTAARKPAIEEKPTGKFMIRSRTRVVKRHPEGDW